MSSVRDWHIGHVAVLWLAMPLVFWALRWLVRAGLYEAEIEGHRVVILSGLWTSSFASLLTIVLAVVCGLVLVGVTVAWLAGRRHRRRVAPSTEDPERRPLM